MENNNLEFLKKNLKFLGFGTSLNAALEAKISERPEQFKLGVSADFSTMKKDGIKNKVNYELNFSKSNKSDFYFLDNLKVNLNEQIENTFSLGKGNDVTAKEAYNLLRGSSILKKALLTDNFNLTYYDDFGKRVEEVKVSSTDEAQKLVSENVKNKINIYGSYTLYDKGYPLRTYEGSTGKDFTSMPDGKIFLSYSYFDKATNKAETVNYLEDSFNKALDTKDNLIKKHQDNHNVQGFSILNESRTTVLYRFDKEGNELSVDAPKRSENIWIKLDFDKRTEDGNYPFKKFYQNYGFNLESELNKYPIKELENHQEKEMLISSVGRGNTQIATLETGQTVWIEADPQIKKIRFYDMDFKELNIFTSQTQEINR